nr:TMV resistance protein N-like [Quercus suber]
MDSKSLSLPSSSSTSSTSQWKYDVFLSFRGEDTRYKFTDHLYKALVQKGIVTFRDDEKLERGKSISSKLLQAIEESRFAIVILSENYATSSWCLDELAKIIECEKELGMTVFPIFHYVDPSDVRKQLGVFKEAFVKHEKRFEKKKVETWRDALSHVGNLAGCHLKNIRYPETQEIRSIVRHISRTVRYKFSELNQGLVGIYPQAMELESLLALDQVDDVRKTIWITMMILSNKIKTRLRRKKILLVLDDVNQLKQLRGLAGERNWFGLGSRIIITTRYKDLLQTHSLTKSEIYEVKPLEYEDARHLFYLKAFKKEHIPDEFLELSNKFLKYVDGLPLALEVLGSFLFGKSIVEWKSALERLKEGPGRIVIQVLEISFDGLDDILKEIFLHIACLFNHEEKDYVVEILRSLDLYPEIGLRELIDKSLLKILDYNKLWMHNLLGEMGRNKVCQYSRDEPGKRRILWLYEDIDYVLKNNTGTEAVQAIDIRGAKDTSIYHEEKEECWRQGSVLLVNLQGQVVSSLYSRGLALLVTLHGWVQKTLSWRGFTSSKNQIGPLWNPNAFLKMPNLKFLRIRNINLLHVPTHLPNNLRFIEWNDYPSKSLPYFQLDELVQLHLQQSKIVRLWEGMKNFNKLKFIDLAGSSALIISPDFTGVLNLEKLVLAWCSNLCELHPSIGNLKKLSLLDLEQCKELSCLPNKFETESLEILNLTHCSKVKKISEFVGNMKRLQKLLLGCTAILELPSSIECLTGLNILILSGCKNLVCLPNTICSLTLLNNLNLFGCSKFDKLPEDLGNMVSLKKLTLCGTAIKELPSSVEFLISLRSLNLTNCKNFVFLPSTICSLKSLFEICLSGCSKFVNLPENLGNLEALHTFTLEETAIEVLPSSIGHLIALRYLSLKDCKNLVCLSSTICNLMELSHVDLSGCSKIVSLPENLGNMESLSTLHLRGTAIKELPSSTVRLQNVMGVCFSEHQWPSSPFDSLPTSLDPVGVLLRLLSSMPIRDLDLRDCHLLAIPNDIGCLSLLNQLRLSGNDFISLPENISQLFRLRLLDLDGCKRLRSLPNLPSKVDCISVNNCTSLKRLPESQNDSFWPCHFQLCFKCINCFKLADNIQSGSNLFKGQSGKLLGRRFPSIIPGSEIPTWSKEVNICEDPYSSFVTSSIFQRYLYLCSFPNLDQIFKIKKVNIQVPFNECDGWRGIVLCFVFVPSERHQRPSLINFQSIKVDGFQTNCCPFDFDVGEKYGKLESHHLGLLYLSNLHNWRTPCVSIDAKEFHQVEIKIAITGFEVEKIGVRLVYKEDIVDLNQTIAHDSSNRSRRRFSSYEVVYSVGW